MASTTNPDEQKSSAPKRRRTTRKASAAAQPKDTTAQTQDASESSAADSSAEKTPRKRSTKRTTKRTTKRSVKQAPEAQAPEAKDSAKKPSKQTAKKTTRSRRPAKKAAAKAPAISWSIEVPAEAKANAAKINRDELEAKTRVHQLARTLEITSKQLITLLGDLGMKKVVMSSLTKDEVVQVVDAISGDAEAASSTEDTSAPAASTPAEEPISKEAPEEAPEEAAEETAPRKRGRARRVTREAAAPSDADIDAENAVISEAEIAEASEQEASVMDEVVVKEGTQKRASRKRRATRSTAAPESTEAAETSEPAASEATAEETAAEEASAEASEKKSKKSKDSKKKDKKSKGKKGSEKKGSAKKSSDKKSSAKKAAAEADGPEDAEALDPKTEKIRQRVEKNVANEIHQIEEKVERELAEKVEEAPELEVEDLETPEAEPADATPATPETPETPEPLFRSPIFLPPTPAAEADAEVLEIIGVSPEELEAEEDSHDDSHSDSHGEDDSEDSDSSSSAKRRRRGRRGGGRGRGSGSGSGSAQDDSQAAEHKKSHKHDQHSQPEELPEEPVALHGSTRLEAQRRRRNEMREEGRKKRHVVSQAEFLARRESVERTMVVRERQRSEGPGNVTEVGVLEDEMLVEHFVTSDAQASMIGNIYLGRVQNVLPSMEAAFIDIGKGRNGVLYAGEVDWRAHGLGGRQRRIEQALKSGDQVLVQVSKDPVGHKGARLTTQISLAGRYLVYVPGGRSAGISRKLPGPERKRLKEVLKKVVPDDGGAIIRTAAEGVAEDAIAADVNRLHSLWQDIEQRSAKEKKSRGNKPVTMYEEPNLLVKVVRDLFNEDFSRLVVDGERPWNTVHAYVQSVAPDLLERLERFDRSEHEGKDAFTVHRIDEQIQKALSRKVWLPSGGTLVIDRTEAMTVIDVNTGKFTGSGGNLEETVTRNNLEAAEEIVRQMRLRDLGGMIVVDFIDMVLPENQDLVLRRLTEALGRDRTRHQVSEVTSLGLVQMTRKRLGTGLMETFSTPCEHCDGTGYQVHADPVEAQEEPEYRGKGRGKNSRGDSRGDSRTEERKDRKGRGAEDAADNAQAEDAPSIEDLVNAVVVEDEATAQETAGQDDNQKQSGRGRRRRVRSRSRQDDRHEDRHDDRQDDSAKDDSSERSIAEITAEAIAVAAKEDPDEPSAADYLPLTDDEDTAGTTGTSDSKPDKQPSRSRQRRNRRAATAARKGTDESKPVVESEIKKQAEVLAKTAPAEDDSQALTYEEAVAAFEASPRRKRRTRGNSRSDHRPRKEDFVDATASDVPDDGFEPVEIDKPAKQDDEQPSRDRRSRRGTRRGGSKRAELSRTDSATPEQSEATEQQDTTASEDAAETKQQTQVRKTRAKRAVRRSLRKQREDAAPEAEDVASEDTTPAEDTAVEKKIVKLKARGRRRAVRRISRTRAAAKKTASEADAPKSSPELASEPEADVQVVKSRRGRRRVVRRSTGR